MRYRQKAFFGTTRERVSSVIAICSEARANGTSEPSQPATYRIYSSGWATLALQLHFSYEVCPPEMGTTSLGLVGTPPQRPPAFPEAYPWDTK